MAQSNFQRRYHYAKPPPVSVGFFVYLLCFNWCQSMYVEAVGVSVRDVGTTEGPWQIIGPGDRIVDLWRSATGDTYRERRA